METPPALQTIRSPCCHTRLIVLLIDWVAKYYNVHSLGPCLMSSYRILIPMIAIELFEQQGLLHYRYIRTKFILKQNLAKSRSSIIYRSVVKSFWNFEQSTAVILPCSVQNFKTIWQICNTLWSNEISRDLSLRCVSILQRTLGCSGTQQRKYHIVGRLFHEFGWHCTKYW